MAKETLILRVVRGRVEDLGDQNSVAEKHLISDQLEGPVIVNSSPPQSIADAQVARNAYDPLNF